jgi:hypothetical protein
MSSKITHGSLARSFDSTQRRGASGPGQDTASAHRLRALIEVLGFEARGAQTRFAGEIGVKRSRLNRVLVGHPLSRQLAENITQHYPSVSTDFLMLGRSGGNLDPELERRLLQYQKKTGISVFTS